MAMIVLPQNVASAGLVCSAKTGAIVTVKDAGLVWQILLEQQRKHAAHV